MTRTPDKATGGKPTAGSLRRIGAYEVSRNLEIREITNAIWIPPRICFCIIRGRVVKPVTHPKGETVDYPVDNNPCEAEINDPAVDANTIADHDCGFYEYPPTGATVALSFLAWHPNRFADFSFKVHRGASVPIDIATASGY